MRVSKLIPISALLLVLPLTTTVYAKQSDSPLNSMTVNQESIARNVITTVPPEAVMERFEMLDSSGRQISYVAFTEGEVGALVFIDKKLFGTLSKRDALAFYSCRGYTTATQYHWGKDAGLWADSLLSRAVSATQVQLQFSGKSTWRSIVEIANNPSLNQISSLIDIGTNPFGILRKLNSARETMAEREQFEKIKQKLSNVSTGASEESVAEIIKPEDVSFVSGGLVMAYPRFTAEFFVSNGSVNLIQQPSFLHLSRKQAALFYVAKAKWTSCTASDWMTALPEEIKSDQSETPVSK